MRDGVVDKRTVDGLTMVTLAGELDVATAPGLRRALTPSAAASMPDLAVDLRRVTYLAADCEHDDVLGWSMTARCSAMPRRACWTSFSVPARRTSGRSAQKPTTFSTMRARRGSFVRPQARPDPALAVGAVQFLAPQTGAVGAGLTALADRLRGTGIDRTFLEEVKAHLRPETSALLVLSSHADLDEVRPVIERGLARGDVVLMHALLQDGAREILHATVRELQNHSRSR